MESIVEKLRRRKEFTHGQLVVGLSAMDAYLCSGGAASREGMFDRLGLVEPERGVYKKVLDLLATDPESCWKLEYYFPQPIVVLGLEGKDTESITLDQGTGSTAGIHRTILPRDGGAGGDRQIFYLGGARADKLPDFFGMPDNPAARFQNALGRFEILGYDSWKQLLWFEDGKAFSVLHLAGGKIIRADYCFEMGKGYWGSRSDLSGEQVMWLFMGGSGKRDFSR